LADGSVAEKILHGRIAYFPQVEYDGQMTCDIEALRADLRAATRSSWRGLAESSGVGETTIEKIVYGITSNPTIDTYNAIRAALDALNNKKE
jgi:hypothetical protein